MRDIIIGIDPDVDKSGIAILNLKTKKLKFKTATFRELCDCFNGAVKTYSRDRVKVIVEASWNTAHNFHLLPTDRPAVAAKKSYHVGRNHQVGMDICQLALLFGLAVYEQEPLRKCWRGPNRKITHEEIVEITGIEARRTNQEERDAILIAWANANLPIYINNKKVDL